MTDRNDILMAVITAAEIKGWEQTSLREVARDLQMPLGAVIREFRDLDAVADEWFRRARAAMVETNTQEGYFDLPAKERLKISMEAWFDELAPHRRITAEMLEAKMWVFHPHHYVPAIFHLSRLIQTLRDVAALDAGGRRRQVEEIALTSLFLATLRIWCRDRTEGQKRTKRFLKWGLKRGDRFMARWPRNL